MGKDKNKSTPIRLWTSTVKLAKVIAKKETEIRKIPVSATHIIHEALINFNQSK